MLNPVLRSGLLPEHRVLYDLKIFLQDEVIKDRIANSVRHIRKVNSRDGEDKTFVKMKKFGNHGEWYFQKARQKIKNLYKLKPISDEFVGQWRSIEFELIFKSKNALEEFKHAARVVGVGEMVTIQDDRSIKDYASGEVPHELVISYRAGDEDSVRKFCNALKGRAYVNHSCGTHFHFDMRQYDEAKVTELGARVAQAVPALRLLLPKDRRESKFQKDIINTTKTPCVYPHKYAFVNLAAYNKHKTMEIRGHSGTINADKILNWIKVIECIMLAPMEPAPISTVDQLIKNYKLDDKLTAYVKDRAHRFEDVRDTAWGTATPRHKSEEEEKPAAKVDVYIHPALLAPIPVAKKAQAAPGQIPNHFIANNQ